MHRVLAVLPRKTSLWLHDLSAPMPDVYWACGYDFVYSILPQNWNGLCARITFISKAHVQLLQSPHDCRAKQKAPQGSFDSKVWIDSIGQPRVVPAQHKALDEAGIGATAVWIAPTVSLQVWVLL